MNTKGPVKYNLDGYEQTANNTNDDDCPNDKVKEESIENADEYMENVQNSTSSTFIISDFSKQTILNILEQINSLTHLERFLIFLKLNEQISNTGDPLKQPLNPLGSRSEVCRTISWIKTHLEEDPEISLPKQQVYDEYSLYCSKIQMKPLSQADFGKVMKQVYPKVKARRLGTRGNSRYCYSGLRNCTKLQIPSLASFETDNSSDIQLAYSQDEKKPLTQLSLTTAAWLIVKEWSENQLNSTFSTIQSLAFFLVVNCSIGIGSEAATQITSMSSSEITDETCELVKNEPSHKDVQMQLQKKLLSKDETSGNNSKERKRKMHQQQSSKTKNFGAKKGRGTAGGGFGSNGGDNIQIASNNNNSETSQSESSASSNNTSPIEGSKPICDKYQDDFNNLKAATLPDFNCFQKPETNDKDKTNVVKVDYHGTVAAGDGGANCAKYKTVQPKPLYQLCDNMYNPLMETTGNRSQNSEFNNLSDNKKLKETTTAVEFLAEELPLSRERLNSISNVDKDAMDDYLGKNNSQHEEELSRYFAEETEETSKISQLRQLLQENARNATTGTSIIEPPPTHINNIYTILNSAGNARRRVSFDVMSSYHDESSTVPPSPNTRRKNFSFTPISPGPNSPNGGGGGGRQSKCSSTSVSPFVSPRNTPVPKGRNYQNLGLTLPSVRKMQQQQQCNKVKKEMDLSSPDMSAPASPCLSSKSMLQTLLNTSGKVSYTPNYISTANQNDHHTPPPLLPPNINNGGVGAFRSQSVPIDKNPFLFNEPMFTGLSQDDFTELDTIDGEKIGVTNIINALHNDEIYNNNNNNEIISQNRSDNIVEMVTRSVPSTPLSFLRNPNLNNGMNDKIVLNNNNSHSYPSTPLMSDEIFTYDMSDCLISGQLIKNDSTTAAPPHQTNNAAVTNQFMDESSSYVSFDSLDEGNVCGVVSDMNFNIALN